MRIRSIAPVLVSVSLIAWIGTSLYLAPASASDCTPTQTTYDTGTTVYTVLQFSTTGTCNWQSPAGVTQADVLLVAGGGGGGSRIGGGGGGGEVRFIENQSVTPSTTYSVVVGQGGAGGSIVGTDGSVGGNGGNSSIFSTTVAGGGGGGFYGPGPGGVGKTGGSGGGGSCLEATLRGSSIKTGSGSGNDGGDGANAGSEFCVAGGGGGAGAAGSAVAFSSQSGGAGGNGVAIAITSTSSTTYGGGGGGGINAPLSNGNPGAGGSGGGGAGGPKNSPEHPTRRADGLAGTDGQGGGGGGGSNYHSSTFDSNTSARGGDGGDGIVIVRYIAPPSFSENTNAVLLVDPRSSSSAIPFVNLSSSAPSRICFDLYTNNAKTTGLDLKDHRYADSSSFRLSRDEGASALTSVLQEDDSKNSKKGMRIQGTKENVNALLKRAQIADPGYLRIHKSDDGWVDGSVLEIRADYGVDNPCSSSTSNTEVTTQIMIKVVGIQVNQRNDVEIN